MRLALKVGAGLVLLFVLAAAAAAFVWFSPGPRVDADTLARYAAWTREHAIALEDPGDRPRWDLGFLDTLVAGKRLVLLGESSHGCSDYHFARLELVRHLHERLGFDLIVFESGLWDCWHTNERLDWLTPRQVLGRSLVAVWHTAEAESLIAYVQARRRAGHALTIAGMDIQRTGREQVPGERSGFVTSWLPALDRALVDSISALERRLRRVRGARLREVQAQLAARYDSAAHRIGALPHGHPKLVAQARFARRVASGYARMGEVARDYRGGFRSRGQWRARHVRDSAMAGNLMFLLDELYPGRRAIVIAHNVHIARDGRKYALFFGAENMGERIASRYGDSAYVVGLFMGRGWHAHNLRGRMPVRPPARASLEGLMLGAGHPAAFLDVSRARGAGSEWLDRPFTSHNWGMLRDTLVHRRQYDAILFVRDVEPPRYVRQLSAGASAARRARR